MPMKINIPEGEIFDNKTQMFFKTKKATLQLEHSLISLRKWESRWHIPFLSDDEKTNEQMMDYIKCMTINGDVDPTTYEYMATDPKIIDSIMAYIKNPMTATWFSKKNTVEGAPPPKKEVITAEIIYYWMISLGIPESFERWHLNQLLTLIKVIELKNAPKKKMDARAAMAERAQLNAARRAKMNSKG